MLAFLTAGSAHAATPLHHYDFNGGTVQDLVGSVDGALLNGAKVEAGVLTTDGVAGHAQFPQNLIPLGSPFSVTFFAKESALISQAEFFIEYGGEQEDGSFGFGDARVGNFVSFSNEQGWHHYAVTAFPNETRLYIDGNRVGSLRSISLGEGGSTTRLGRFFDPHQQFSKGWMDELWVFNGVLSGEEILDLSRQPHSGNPQTISWTGTSNDFCRSTLRIR